MGFNVVTAPRDVVIARRADWLPRLRQLLEDARDRPFVWGEHDCARFALCAWTELTGAAPLTPPPDWSNMEEASARLSEKSLEDWAAEWFGEGRPGWAYARRGDVVSFNALPGGLDFGLVGLGVMENGKIAVLGESRLQWMPLKAARLTFRVGE